MWLRPPIHWGSSWLKFVSERHLTWRNIGGVYCKRRERERRGGEGESRRWKTASKIIWFPFLFNHSDYLFKLLLIGDSGVGKSCLLLRFAVSLPTLQWMWACDSCTPHHMIVCLLSLVLLCSSYVLHQWGTIKYMHLCTDLGVYHTLSWLLSLLPPPPPLSPSLSLSLSHTHTHTPLLQDDTYTDSYISTIGVDFVSYVCVCVPPSLPLSTLWVFSLHPLCPWTPIVPLYSCSTIQIIVHIHTWQ